MRPVQFQTVANIVCELGSARTKLAGITRGLGRRALVITDQGVLDHGILTPALDAMRRTPGLDVAVFSGVVADPPEHVVEAAALTARDFQADVVIGFGGGSPMDIAKLVAFLVRTPAASYSSLLCLRHPFSTGLGASGGYAAPRRHLRRRHVQGSEVAARASSHHGRRALDPCPQKSRAAQDGEARVGTGAAGTGSEVTPISIITTGTLLPTSNRHHAHAWTRTHRARPL